jgi:hypothetical protein
MGLLSHLSRRRASRSLTEKFAGLGHRPTHISQLDAASEHMTQRGGLMCGADGYGVLDLRLPVISSLNRS